MITDNRILLIAFLVLFSFFIPETSTSPAITFGLNATRLKRQTGTTCPERGQWQCRDGQCIASTSLCDGAVDCTDGSDESFSACRNTNCRSYLFRCTYGACVDVDAKCNGVQDCADNSDELHKDCSTTTVKNTCRHKGDFQCSDGSCISPQFLCDGVDNCPDKSDESVAQCSHFRCRSNLFRCAYGACVDGDSQCNNVKDCSDGSDEDPALCYGTRNWEPLRNETTTTPPKTDRVTPATPANGCVMPEPPENGMYLLRGKPSTIPPGGTVPPYSLLEYSCHKNYDLDGNSAVFCSDDYSWSEIPNCLRKCNPLVSLTADLMCMDSSFNAIPCGDFMPHGSTVTAICKPQHFPRDGRLRKLTCSEGSWDYPTPRCDPECGLEKSQGIAFVIGGFKVKRGGFPWHVGVFDVNDLEKPNCGGTIIATNKVISAAHCFYDENAKEAVAADQFWIAAGKLYGNFYDPEDAKYSYVQTSKIKQIHIPPFYGGDEQNQQNDIAIVILETPFVFSDSVHAACLDLSNIEFDSSQTSPGKTGKVSGWGLTSEGGQPSEILKALVVPLIDYNTCRNDVPAAFKRYLTTDKLCAGYKNNGTSLCRGDSGGGLVVSAPVWDQERWYLRGVVSVGPKNDEMDSCRSNSYTAFTHVFKLNSWILDIITE